MNGPARHLALVALPLAAAVALAVQAASPKDAADQHVAAVKPAALTTCTACHGVAGEGLGAFPRLASLGDAYLLRQLAAFADGSRPSPVMVPIAASLAATDRSALATYFSTLPPPATARQPAATASVAPPAATSATSPAAAATLATRGRWSDGVPACEQCHGPGGRGVGPDFPALAGQPADYLEAQLQAWKSGARPPGPLGVMAVVAKKLSDAEVRSVARHFAALPATAALPAAKAVP